MNPVHAGAMPALHDPRCAWASAAPVRIRAVRPGDAALLDELIKGLSPASRRLRFHGAVRQLPMAVLQRMVRPDPQHELALVAVVDALGRECCVGEARYAVDDQADGAREFALVVADGWRGCGLGKALLARLVAQAARQGVQRLYGDVLRENAPMLALAAGLGFRAHSHPHDPRLLRMERLSAPVPIRQIPRGEGRPSFS